MGVRSLATGEANRRFMPPARGCLERPVMSGSAVVDPGPVPLEECEKAASDLPPTDPPLTALRRRFHCGPSDLAVAAAYRWSRRLTRRTKASA